MSSFSYSHPSVVVLASRAISPPSPSPVTLRFPLRSHSVSCSRSPPAMAATAKAEEAGGRRRVGLVYDERMCGHATPDGESHPEDPDRIRAIWRKLQAEGITQRCVVLNAKEAEDKYIASVHTKNHIKLIRNISSKEYDSRRLRIASKFNSIYFNEGSSESAYLAAGSVLEASEKVARGELNSAIAIVRPPGHHAEYDKAMGFCLFNNVAIAASFLLNELEFGIKKILIVDWDVHHGNGTQKMFYKDPRVLFFSVHRFDFGTFYPAGGDGSHCMIGDGPGTGYNVNVPWEHGQCGDADYLAVWNHLLIPVAEAYNPDIILISAGFDAAMGDPLGGCCITPYGYSVLLEKLMRFAQGKIVMALEGGYNLNSIANSVLACAKVLLGESSNVSSVEAQPFESTWRVIREVRHELKTFWPIFAVELPEKVLISSGRPHLLVNLDTSSESEMENEGSSGTIGTNIVGVVEDDVILPLSKLNIDEDNQEKVISSNRISTEQRSIISSEACQSAQAPAPAKIAEACISWRSVLSKTEVWYGTFGSNMWKARFLCYIEGGQVEGMNTPYSGSHDKSPPKDVVWKMVPHRLFFGRSHTQTWGPGGVAFLHPESSADEKAYICMYKITLEQFNDVLFQENILHQEDGTTPDMGSPLLDLSDVDFVVENKSVILGAIKDGWYSNILYLGKRDSLPILTMTCSFSDVKQFKSGELPQSAPSESYMNTLVKGLVEGKQLTRDEAIGYLNDAAMRKL